MRAARLQYQSEDLVACTWRYLIRTIYKCNTGEETQNLSSCLLTYISPAAYGYFRELKKIPPQT